MIRRLLAMVAAMTVLFGTVQPAFACSTGDDCCNTGSADCASQDPFASAPDDTTRCCIAQYAATPSVSISPRTRHAGAHAPGSSDPVLLPEQRIDLQRVGYLKAWLPSPTGHRRDESSIYLLTARLRL